VDHHPGKIQESPAQEKVIRLLLERGFQINSEGRVVSGNIEYLIHR